MSKAIEREDDIERSLHEGRVHRWSRRRPAWPGHTTFVALKGGMVVVGDRYAAEGVERTYDCDPASLIEGMFRDVIADQLGKDVLEEVLAEVRRDLGDAKPAIPKQLDPPKNEAPRPAIALPPSTFVKPLGSPPPPVAPKPVVTPAPAPASRFDVTVVSCGSIGLPLVVTLREITRSPVKELLSGMRAPPFCVAKSLSRDHAEALSARIAGLGAEIQILPAA